MAFDGIITAAAAEELRRNLLLGRIDKIYQPEPDEILLQVYTKNGIKRVYATTDSASASVRLLAKNTVNPPVPLAFCMLLRKHLSGARISDIQQKDSERILEISMETVNELGFTVSRKLIFEIMGKHSNIVLVDLESGKILGSIKKISIDMNRARQILPGKVYEYPPVQDKIPFRDATAEDLDEAGENGKMILSRIGGISPAVARELALQENRKEFLDRALSMIEEESYQAIVYRDSEGMPREYSIFPMAEYEQTCEALPFPTLSEAMDYFYENREQSSRARQHAHDLVHAVKHKLDRLYLKKQKLSEELKEAQDSETLRLYGELLTANLHLVPPGQSSVTVISYYDNQPVTIPLDPRYTPNKNAQRYFKRYGKSKTAVKEKQVQLAENQQSIDYLESVLTYLDNTSEIKDIEDLRQELTETGFLRLRKKQKMPRAKKYKPTPMHFYTSDGFSMLIGRNNKENDELTLHIASKTDYWLHTKDIPGSHVIVETGGRELTETAIFEAASAAAFYSKARTGENIPVDYVKVRYVKKPSGSKPGMVIFTNNRTVYVNPKEPTRTQPPAPAEEAEE